MESHLMNYRNTTEKPDQPDQGLRLAFQTVAVISLACVFGEKSWRLLRDLNRQYNFSGRG